MSTVYAPEEFTRTFLRHFVSIICVESGSLVDKHNGGEPLHHHFSGFVIEHGDSWAVVTAGHIFSMLKERAKAGAIFTQWQLDDSAVSSAPQPPHFFALDIEKEVLFLYDDVPGMDYAVFRLSELTRMGAEREGIVPIRREQWCTDSLAQFDTWLLVGVPGETVKISREAKVQEKYIVTMKLDRVFSQPTNLNKTEFERLYAKIDFSSIGDNGPKVTDIAGMSGGPVFGVRGTPTNLQYRLIGVQSSWNQKDSVAICAAQPFLDAVNQVMAPSTHPKA